MTISNLKLKVLPRAAIKAGIRVNVGPPGPTGATGYGVPSGGTTNQVLRKASTNNYDFEYHTPVKADVGLGNADNTSDANKPVSTATQTALDAKVAGPASVTDGNPALFDDTTGKLIKQATFAAFKALLTLVKGDVGLGNADNTADTAKPVSTAQQTALNLKADLASPTFTGNPIAPTQSAGNNSTRLATTAYADAAAGAATPAASTTVSGIVELATTTETITGTDAVRAIVPTALKIVRDDRDGVLVTTGPANTYAVTTGGTIIALATGRAIRVRINTSCTAAATLDVNGLGAKSIRKFDGTIDVPLTGGELQTRAPVDLVYSASFDSSAGGWGIGSWPNIADATTAGIVELATNAEALTGTDTTRAVTAAGVKGVADLKAPLASPTFTGTPAAPTASPGTNTTQLATTAFVTAAAPAASTTVSGIVELATDAETQAGTDTTRAVTPSNLKAKTSFSANKAAADQTGITSGSYVKLTFGTEEWDTGGSFASSTWTPPAGKYVCHAVAQIKNTNGVDGENLVIAIYKNGTSYKESKMARSSTAAQTTVVQAVLSANGTDTFEVYVRKSGAGDGTVDGTAAFTFFDGASV